MNAHAKVLAVELDRYMQRVLQVAQALDAGMSKREQQSVAKALRLFVSMSVETTARKLVEADSANAQGGA